MPFVTTYRQGHRSCAALNGIDQSVIERAEELLLLEAQGVNLVSACASTEDDQEVEDSVRAVSRRLCVGRGRDELSRAS